MNCEKGSLANEPPTAWRVTNAKSIIRRLVPKKKRMENSKDGKTLRLRDGVSMVKWCEMCGDPFETVERGRISCAKCSAAVLKWNVEKADVHPVFLEPSKEAKNLIRKEGLE